MDPIIGQIILFAGTFAPVGWALCNGQLLPIQENQALFSLLSFKYGGDGRTTFGVPDLRGRVPVHCGKATNSSTDYSLGDTGGVEAVALNLMQMPSHSHGFTLACNSSDASEASPVNNYLGTGGGQIYSATTNAAMQSGVSTTVGDGGPHENRPPYLALNFIIAVSGLYPERP